MGQELELKLNVGDLQLLDFILTDRPVRELAQEPYRYIRMNTTYFDTEDGAVSKRKWMLRLRTENDESVVTFKTPGDGHARGEWECRTEYLDEAIPALVADGAPQELLQIDAEELTACCGVRFTRIAALLKAEDGTAFEICGDIGTLQNGTKSEDFVELELELKEGSEEIMLTFGELLQRTYGIREQKDSKFVRAKNLGN